MTDPITPQQADREAAHTQEMTQWLGELRGYYWSSDEMRARIHDYVAHHAQQARLEERKRCSALVCSGCAAGDPFNSIGYHQRGLVTTPCHATAIRKGEAA